MKVDFYWKYDKESCESRGGQHIGSVDMPFKPERGMIIRFKHYYLDVWESDYDANEGKLYVYCFDKTFEMTKFKDHYAEKFPEDPKPLQVAARLEGLI